MRLRSCTKAWRSVIRASALCGAVVATAAGIEACASGGDGDGTYEEGGPGYYDEASVGVGDEGGATGIDAGGPRTGADSGPVRGVDSGSDPGPDASSSGGDDAATQEDGSTGVSDDSGSSFADSGSPPPETDSGTTTNTAVCPNSGIYAAEAVIAAANSPTFCPTGPGVCPAADCCYEMFSPLAICVSK